MRAEGDEGFGGGIDPLTGGRPDSGSLPGAGRAGVGECSKSNPPQSPATGARDETIGLRAIEDIRLGDLVIGHEGQSHRVLRTLRRRYVGPMIGLKCAKGPTLWVTAEHLVLTQRRVQALSDIGGWNGIPATHLEYARTLRKESSPPERVLWGRLRNRQLGVKFRRQHQIGPFIADFYSRDAGLVVEVDGETHSTPEGVAYDKQRDAWMTQRGLTIRRFTANEVGSNHDDVVEEIWNESRQAVLEDEPSKQWGSCGSTFDWRCRFRERESAYLTAGECRSNGVG